MAAPLFYGVALVVGLTIQWMKNRQQPLPVVVLLPLLLSSMEGLTPALSFDRHETVVASAVVVAPTDAVRDALSRAPRFDRALPLYLRMGFPRPDGAAGSGLCVGDRRVVQFVCCGGGALTLVVTHSEPGHVVFEPASDTSKISRWLRWKRADVRWHAESGGTRVTWTLEYDRRLDPAWYFAPFERYAAGLAAGYLIEAAATP